MLVESLAQSRLLDVESHGTMCKIKLSVDCCKRRSGKLKKQEETFDCVACGCSIHLSEVCTGPLELAFKVIQVLGPNALLLCNDCVRKEQHPRLKMLAKGGTERKPTQSFETELSDLQRSVQRNQVDSGRKSFGWTTHSPAGTTTSQG